MCYTMKQKHFYSSGPCAGLCAVTCTGSHAQVLETLTEGTRTGISKDHHLVSMKKCNPYQAPRPRFLACKPQVDRDKTCACLSLVQLLWSVCVSFECLKNSKAKGWFRLTQVCSMTQHMIKVTVPVSEHFWRIVGPSAFAQRPRCLCLPVCSPSRHSRLHTIREKLVFIGTCSVTTALVSAFTKKVTRNSDSELSGVGELGGLNGKETAWADRRRPYSESWCDTHERDSIMMVSYR